MNISFASVAELKTRLTPALRLRRKQLKSQNIIIDEESLWTFFVNNYWKNAKNLSLYEMVNDILNEEVKIGGEQDE